MHLRFRITSILLASLPLWGGMGWGTASAQVGEYRNRFSLGVGGGYVMNSIDFQPTVLQNMHKGATAGIVGRYTSEKYFSTLCAVQVEANITKTGWEQDISTIGGEAVVNPVTGVAERYRRDLTYVQVPVLAHLSWGYEQKGLNFFFNLGPQVGFCIADKYSCNYAQPFVKENFPDDYNSLTGRASQIVAQETMPVENKFDFGITLGLGVEAHASHVGRFDLEARYYYGLGNIYGDSKRDYFAKSSHGMIYVKLAWLYDF